MFLLVAVLNEEEVLDDVLTGWIEIGVTGATVLDSTDSLQLVSHHVPIFAGFRALTSGGMRHNRTLFAVIESEAVLDQAIGLLESVCSGKESSLGIWFTLPVARFRRLGATLNDEERQEHLRRKLGLPTD